MTKPAQIVSSVLSVFRRWIAPPAFAGEDKTRLTALLDTLLLITVGLWWFLLILLAAFRLGNRTNMLIACGASVLLLGVRELLRRRHMAAALVLGISLGWGVFTGYLYNMGTPNAVHLVGYLMLLIIAIWLGGFRAGAAVGLLSTVSVFALARAETAGLLPPAVRMQPLHLALNMAGYLGVAASLAFLVRTNLLRALRLAQAEIAERQRVLDELDRRIQDLIAVRLQNALLYQEMRERAAGLEEIVSERTRELQAERDRTQAVLETVGESVVVTDLDGQLLFINPATTALTGHARDEELGRPLWRTWTEQARTEIWPEAQAALRAGQAWHGEISGQQRNGALYVAVLTATPLYDADVTLGPVGAVWAQRDITLAKEAARLRDQFVANVSHELRTLISIVALGCNNLEAFHDRLDEGQRLAIVRDIREQANRLSAIVADTLQISQIDAGRMPMERQRLDLAQLVREEAAGLQPFIERRGQRLDVAAAAAVTVLGNETQLRQVVRNLLDNAIKYTLAGRQISCTCEVRAAASATTHPERSIAQSKDTPGGGEAWAVVEVTDEGIGIAARDLPYLFERFYRVNAEGATPGTGLGLPIAQELIALHRGWINVASTHGQGSTFTVYLPLAGEA